MALDKIGPYEFQGILGRGGMGTVYRARHEESGELHAVKVLAPTYAHDPHFRGRFESEIKSLIKLDHPNIVRLLSYGQEDGMLFFSMELVEGNSLFQLQRQGHVFDWREVLSIAKDVCKGLRHAHDRGIIHRDLKPGNLLRMIDEDGKTGQIKITDFGIAKRYGTSQNTGDNVLGTMDFMSPEQAKGEKVTIRSDLYSLGTLLFTLLAGKPPFTANSVEASLRNLTRVPAPRIGKVVPDVPKDLDKLINKLMAKKPENRVQTAQALLHQIDEVESKLRGDSQAQTAERPIPPIPMGDTFDVSIPHTRENTRVLDKKKKTSVADPAKATVELTGHAPGLGDLPAGAKVDYFNTLTDADRKKQHSQDQDAAPDKRGIFTISLALIVVTALAIFGVYQATRPPSSEALYTEIVGSLDRPDKVLAEIDTFLENYPEEPRAPEVEKLKEIGEAIDLYNDLRNALTARSKLAGENRLTEIEKMFLSIVQLSEDNPTLADAKMVAFIRIHDGTTELSVRDQKCIDAAKSYKIKLQNDARAMLRENLKRIRGAMMNASQATDRQSAILIYESLIQLYGDTEWGAFDEAREGEKMMAKARQLLKATREAQKLQDEKEAADTKAAQEQSDTGSNKNDSSQ